MDQPDHVPLGVLVVETKAPIGEDQGQLGFVFIDPVQHRFNARTTPSSKLHLAQLLDRLHRIHGADLRIEVNQVDALRIHHAEDGVDFTDEDLEFLVGHGTRGIHGHGNAHQGLAAKPRQDDAREVATVEFLERVVVLVEGEQVLLQDAIPGQLGFQQAIQEDLDFPSDASWLVVIHPGL